ncbi:hypothetical protein SAMN05443246_4855 [Paenibacillus sp. GP183]|nr:hypothetical protein SAMN05443246_4855 [Paenibacillus sp. GP183]
MSTITGTCKVIINTGTIINGNSNIISPTQNFKSINGSGAGITGDQALIFSNISATITRSGSIIR